MFKNSKIRYFSTSADMEILQRFLILNHVDPMDFVNITKFN